MPQIIISPIQLNQQPFGIRINTSIYGCWKWKTAYWVLLLSLPVPVCLESVVPKQIKLQVWPLCLHRWEAYLHRAIDRALPRAKRLRMNWATFLAFGIFGAMLLAAMIIAATRRCMKAPTPVLLRIPHPTLAERRMNC